jgi:lipid-binding SYLF domain-containing protein
MKTFLSLLALAMVGVSISSVRADTDRTTLMTEVESCRAILEDFQGASTTAIPDQVWQSAKAVVIVNQFKAGFIFGVKGGYGVVMVKKANGRWSVPALLYANEASLGLQAGAKTVETIYIITDNETPKLLFRQRVNFGVDAKAVIGPKAADIERNYRPLISTPVLVYVKESGLYAGATVKAAQVARNDEAGFILYNTKYTLPELLYSDWVTPPTDVLPIMNVVQKLAP